MKKQQHFFGSAFKAICLLFFPIAFISSVELSSSALTQENNIPQERELYNTLPGANSQDNILNVTNPMELMNRLRRATAMENATSPSDAIDEALRALEEKDP